MSTLRIRTGKTVLELASTATLAELHARLSPGSAELHEFAAGGALYGEPDADDQLVGRRVVDDRDVRLAELAGKKLEYRCGGQSAEIRIGRPTTI